MGEILLELCTDERDCRDVRLDIMAALDKLPLRQAWDLAWTAAGYTQAEIGGDKQQRISERLEKAQKTVKTALILQGRVEGELQRLCVCGEPIRMNRRLCDECAVEYGLESDDWPKWLRAWMADYQSELDYDKAHKNDISLDLIYEINDDEDEWD